MVQLRKKEAKLVPYRRLSAESRLLIYDIGNVYYRGKDKHHCEKL